MNCVNTKSDEYKELLRVSGIPSIILEMRVSDWQEVNGLENFPSLEDILQEQEMPETPLAYKNEQGEVFDTYKEALDATSDGELSIESDGKEIAKVNVDTNVDTFHGTVNHLVKQGGLTGERIVDTNGDVIYVTEGKSETAKQLTANLVEEQAVKLLGQSNVTRTKTGDFKFKDGLDKITINGEQFNKKEIDALNFEQLTKKFGEDTALRIELMREYANALQPSFAKKVLEEATEVREEDDLVKAVKSLLNKLGIKITSIEDYVKNNTIKNEGVEPTATALMDVVNKIIAFKDGVITREDLIEEVMHLIEATIDPKVTEGVRRNIDKTDEWKQYSQQYYDIYSKEYSGEKLEEMVRREILGKVMANAVLNNFALEENATQTKQSIFAKIKEVLQQFFENIEAYFKEDYRKQIDNLNRDIYVKLMSGSILNEMNLDQNFGTKFRLYSASRSSADEITLIQKQAEKALEVLRADNLGGIAQAMAMKPTKEIVERSIEHFQAGQEKEAKLEMVVAFSKIASMVKNQVRYLERALKKAEANQHPFSAEEMAVYTNLVYQFDNSILPTTLDVLKTQSYNTKAELRLIEELEKTQVDIANLKGKVGTNGFNATDYTVKLLVNRLGLDAEKEKFLMEQVSSTQKEANWFFMQFGNLSHSSNIFLNALGHIVTKVDFDKKQGFMENVKPFIAKLAKLGTLEGKSLSQFVRGNHLQSAYNFQAIEKAELEETSRLYYEALKERLLENLTPEERAKTENRIANPLSMEEFAKISVFDDLSAKGSAKFRRDLDTWKVEQFKMSPFSIAEMEERKEKLKDLSQITQEFEASRKANYAHIMTLAEEVNGVKVFTKDMRFELEELKKVKVEAKSVFDRDGDLKLGIVFAEETTPEAVKAGSNLYITLDRTVADEAGILAFELTKLDNQKMEEAKAMAGTSSGLSSKFKDTLNSMSAEDAYDFLTLNAYIGYTQEYYDSFTRPSMIDKLEKQKDGDNDVDIEDLVERIATTSKKIGIIIQANRKLNSPSETNFDRMDASEVKSVKDYSQDLERYYQEARKFLPKEEITTDEESLSETTYNQAFLDYLYDTERDLFSKGVRTDYSEETTLDAEAKKSISKILEQVVNHTTELKKGEILDLKRQIPLIASGKVNKLSKAQKRVFELTDEDIVTMTEEELTAVLSNRLLQYSFTKLLPYFKKTQPKGVEDALSDLETGVVSASEFLNNYENGEYQYLEISPNYNFQEATVDNNKSPHFQNARDNNAPMFRIFEDGVTEEDLKGKSPGQLQKDGKINRYVDTAFLEEYGIDMETLFKTGVEKATKNTEKFETRQALLELQKDSLEKVGKLGTHNIYQLPQKEKSKTRKLDNFFSSGKSLKSMFDEVVNFREDDIELGEDNQGGNTQSISNLSVPIFGVRRLVDAPVTDDLLESYVWMNYKANEHKARKDNYQDAFNLGIAAFGDEFGNKISSEAGGNYKMFKEAMDYNFYGIKETWSKKFTIPLINKEVDLARILQSFGQWIRIRNLGFTLISPVTSATTGFVFKGLERMIGENVDKDAEKASNKFFTKHASESALEMLSLESKTVLNSLGELYGWYDPLERYENTMYSKAVRGLGKSAMAAHQLANFPVNTRVGLSVLANHRFYEGQLIEFREFKKLFPAKTEKEIRDIWKDQYSVLDSVKSNEDGSITYNYEKIAEALNNGFTEEEAKTFLDFKNSSVISGRIKGAIQKIDGQISEEDRSMSTRNAFFSFVNIHRSWLFIALQNKFKGRQLNTQTGYIEEGSVMSTLKFFGQIIKDSKKNGVLQTLGNIKRDWSTYDEVTKRNVMRTLYETALLNSMVALLAMAMKELGEPDDDDSYAFKVSTLMLMRTTNEVASSSVALHKNVIEMLDNVVVGMNAVEIVTTSPDIFSSDIVKRGKYAGLTEREKFLYKQVPIMRDYNNLFRDVEGNIKSYNYFNFVDQGNIDWTIYPYLQEEEEE